MIGAGVDVGDFALRYKFARKFIKKHPILSKLASAAIKYHLGRKLRSSKQGLDNKDTLKKLKFLNQKGTKTVESEDLDRKYRELGGE